jgi:hypothetical protein
MMTISNTRDDVKVNPPLGLRFELNAFEEVAEAHAQGARQAGDVVEGRIAKTEFDPAKIGSVNPYFGGESLLGDAALVAQLAYARTEASTDVVVPSSHAPSCVDVDYWSTEYE